MGEIISLCVTLQVGTISEPKSFTGKEDKFMNTKTTPDSNAEKCPDDWMSGDDPMTGAQASYLQTLCEQAHCPEAFDADLTKAEASKLIDEMRQKTGLAG
jgi:hypothetical protein